MPHPLLLDEMFSNTIAEQLSIRGRDVRAVIADRSLVGLPDERILAQAAAEGRALVTANIRDFVPLDALHRAVGRPHAGIVLVAARTFPQNRTFTGALVDGLARLLKDPDGIGPDRMVFLRR